MQKFATTAAITTVLDIPAGRIQLIAADRADATVDVRPANAAKGNDVKAAEEITVEFSDGVLRIAAAPAKNKILGDSGSVEVTVQLPAGSRVEAKTAAAELRGVGRLGDVTVEGAQGTVKLDETAGARLTLLAGDITVGRLGGPAEISTKKGDLRIAEATQGTVELRTESGEIVVGAARGVSATLNAGTAYGRVHNALTNTDGAAAGLHIHATTSYGDITARSL
ncbi:MULTISPECIES: DUF4097 family beta strand repeat-containing protein [unclassified Streptomyces]|uniref:DUF4097 family beta strand repeat-containing protein n=1 Tax=unclassified Streptomyces TaxID=2593676 RepID=UPI001654F410|nr:DUF4097 family beta strand repeat-containing protein [Streptomyces sp. CB02980]MCB8905208.1 DUF4097 domain-containing protein [Streptomyces sp. CB02980]